MLRPAKPQSCNFIKKETLPQAFPCEICEIPKNTYFTEHLWETACETCNVFPLIRALSAYLISKLKVQQGRRRKEACSPEISKLCDFCFSNNNK